MSFTYAGTSTANLAGVTAVLQEWPSLGGHTIESTAVTGKDGRFFHDSTRVATRFVFDVIIEGSTPQQTGERRDAFTRLIDPAQGPRSLVLDADSGWIYHDVLVAEEITWTRMTWERGLGFRLRAQVAFETQGDPTARQLDPDVLTGTGSLTYTHTLGTTSAYPTLSFAPLTAQTSYDIRIGTHELAISRFASWTGNHRLVLDYEHMAFHLETSAGQRVASAVRHMSNYQRPALHQGQTYQVSVTPERPFRFHPNARRA
ncbi:hypothetical protein M3B43_07395 [Nesterenkonia massiliensis]|uniref:Uncharacterized protein n=1 Tax=Nesterenkonia massiliensis TaxID=1232429 RepID=A0ABT2HR33_9MICC|nr:hypothetical protein [Nesterenkonia massiliensis]MCT1607152.1 hypothetical protein [Nesterenkonia massiliensis]